MSFFCFNSDCKEIDLTERWFKQRSFLYGDGHFTTASVQRGEIDLLGRHIERLKSASERLRFNTVNWIKLRETLSELVRSVEFGIVKVQIDRGAGIRGYGNTLDTTPTIFVWVTETTQEKFINVKNLPLVAIRLSHNRLLAGLKHTNRIEQALIAVELETAGETDGLVLDVDGNLIETNKANVYWYESGQWFTPCLTLCGVNGVVRQETLARNPDIMIVQKQASEVIKKAQAFVISNGLVKLQAVEKINGKSLDVNIANEFIANIGL